MMKYCIVVIVVLVDYPTTILAFYDSPFLVTFNTWYSYIPVRMPTSLYNTNTPIHTTALKVSMGHP